MFCQYQYYRYIKKLQTAVAHSDEKYQCKKMSDCPYTGTTVINKIPWGDWPAGESESDDYDWDSDSRRRRRRKKKPWPRLAGDKGRRGNSDLRK